MNARRSLAGRMTIALIGVAAASAAVTALASKWLLSAWLAAALAVLITVPFALWAASRTMRRWSQLSRALRDGLLSLRDRDFAISIGPATNDEIGEVVAAYNSIGDLLRRERADVYQRELLLDTVIQTTPLAMVLTNAGGRVVHSNIAARQLFMGGRKLEGLTFESLIETTYPALQNALASDEDTLLTLADAQASQVYLVSQRHFRLNAQPHRLVLLKQLTRELAAQEVAVWKRVIRVIAHELNNSLAPISSLAHSAQSMLSVSATMPLEGVSATTRLERVLAMIENRAAHLAVFIDGYARFAKLPPPRVRQMNWSDFFDLLSGTVAFHLQGSLPPTPAWLDPSQLEQVMINLLKNAAESGSPPSEIVVSVKEHVRGSSIEVLDRGTGLSEAQLRDALLPFYSTKPGGAGLGLTLCREIVEAHGGHLRLGARVGGGCAASIWLPARPAGNASTDSVATSISAR